MKTAVQQKFSYYPDNVKVTLLQLRTLLLSIIEQQHLGPVEETLKWG